MGIGIRTALPEPLDMMIRRGIGRPPTQVQPQAPIATEQSQTDSVPDENGVPRFADGLIDFAKALMPTMAGAGIGALIGGGDGALLGAQAGASFQEGKVEQERAVEKQEAEAAAATTKNQIDAYKAYTDRLEASARASGNTIEPKYFQSGNVVLRINSDGTQEEIQISGQKGQFLTTKDGLVLYGNPATGELQTVYKAPEETGPPEDAIKRYNTALASINDKLINGTYDVDAALTQAQLAATGAGLEWTEGEEQARRAVFERFQQPERARALGQLTSTMQTEILNTEVFLDAIERVDRLLDNPVVQQNVGLIPGTVQDLRARVNAESLAPELQRFYSELKNAFDLLVRTRTGAAMSLQEEDFYKSLFGSTRNSVANLRQSLDVQRQGSLQLIENAFKMGPIQYEETNPKRMSNERVKEILRADPDNPPEDVLAEFRRRRSRGLFF